MDLNKYLRSIVNDKIRPLFIKDKCEVCNKNEELHLHHVVLFSEIVNGTLEELKMNYRQTEEYSNLELNMIVNIVLGKHISMEYLTLCKECHKAVHKDNWTNTTVNNKHIQHYENLRLKKKSIIQTHIDNVLFPYLDNISNVKLYKDEKEKLKELFNKFDVRTLGINSLNSIMEDFRIPFVIEIGKRKSYKDDIGKIKKEQSYWIIRKVGNIE